MPTTLNSTTGFEQLVLLQLGERIRCSRLKLGTSATSFAQKVGISRSTLRAVESGEPTPTMGMYLRVMSGLGLAGDMAFAATHTLRTMQSTERKTRRIKRPYSTLVLSVDSDSQITQDFQSLLLHKEAVKLIENNSELLKKAQDTLACWRTNGHSHSQQLLNEWAAILHRREWRKALGNTSRARELRQASPLPILVPQETRLRITAEIQELKAGMVLI